MKKKDIDYLDLQILSELHKDPQLANNELAEKIGLTAGPTLTRVNTLTKKGIIMGSSLKMNYGYFGMDTVLVFRIKFLPDAYFNLHDRLITNPFVYSFFEVLEPKDIGLRSIMGFVRQWSNDKARMEIEKVCQGLDGILTVNINTTIAHYESFVDLAVVMRDF